MAPQEREDCYERTIGKVFVWTFALIGLGIILQIVLPIWYHRDDRLESGYIPTALASAALFLVVILVVGIIRCGPPPWAWVLGTLCISVVAAFAVILPALTIANCALDAAPRRDVVATVTRESKGAAILVVDPGQPYAGEQISSDYGLPGDHQVGRKWTLSVHPGRLGYPWASSAHPD
ncbi:hypothetical protein GCM10009765_23010 [Fodinicola feengrottensis]|uniref:Uncharacterized protein n=1 Tax=Fodinicola feengrottensis TaxID=435914 RepID=A0ABN2GLK6_9ACTN